MALNFTLANCVHKAAMQNVALSVHCDLLLSYVNPFEGIGPAQSPSVFSNGCFANSTGAMPLFLYI